MPKNLREKLAARYHDEWVRIRLADGWQCGEELDARRKTHPCLREYSLLSEREKGFDRALADQILSGIEEFGYIVRPIETSDASLSAVPEDLCEKLAARSHEAWMQARLTDGWRYSEELDAARKTHPCLLAYDELSESDREFDRHLVVQTFQSIHEFGYLVSQS